MNPPCSTVTPAPDVPDRLTCRAMPFNEAEIARLQSSGILKDIPQAVLLAAIEKNADCRCDLQINEILIEAGQLKPGLYLVAHGMLELFMSSVDGREKVLDFATAGDTLAEETLFSDRPLQYSVRSLTPVAVLHLPNEILSAWIASYPGFARGLIALVAKRISFLYKDMLSFCTRKATARLVCYIVCHFDKAPKTEEGTRPLQIAVPRHRIASRLGLSDSHLSRSFRELQKRGLIVREGGSYFVPDVPALAKYVCPSGCDF